MQGFPPTERMPLCSTGCSYAFMIAYTPRSVKFAICRSWHVRTSCWATSSLLMTLPAHVQAPTQASQLIITQSVIRALSILLLSMGALPIKMQFSQPSSFSQPKKWLRPPSLVTSSPWRPQPPCRQSTQQPNPPAGTIHASCTASSAQQAARPVTLL